MQENLENNKIVPEFVGTPTFHMVENNSHLQILLATVEKEIPSEAPG